MNPLARAMKFFEKEKDTTQVFDASNVSVFIENCENFNLNLTGKMVKVMIVNCKNCTFTINGTIITGMIEITKTSGSSLHIKTPVPTLHIELCANLIITATNKTLLRSIISAATLNIKFSINSSDYLITPENDDDSNRNTQQYISRFIGANSNLITEKVVREGAGYATTQREKDMADEKDRRLEEALENLLKEQLKETVVQKPKFDEPKILERNVQKVVDFKSEKEEAKKTEEKEEQKEEEKEAEESSFLKDIQSFKKGKLKPTETVVRNLVSVSDACGPKVGHGHSNAEDIIEYIDSEEVLSKKIELLANLIKESKNCVFYTGAGISTNAKLPDYRGPEGTWTRQDKGLTPLQGVTLDKASPTFTHKSIVKLVEAGLVKMVVSTNVDGLHLRSGLTSKTLAELHGNAYLEKCEKCSKEYLRDFDCIAQGQRKDHYTGRNCDSCNGKLKDSIINFGESLPLQEYNKAAEASQNADLCVVLGTSMRVKPACDLPLMNPKMKKAKLVIINLQKTPHDQLAWFHLFSDCDAAFVYLMDLIDLKEKKSEEK